jgi:serine phosphatase RsbU (regulator of sigma subunit)
MSAVLGVECMERPAVAFAAASGVSEVTREVAKAMQSTLVPPLHYRGHRLEACGQCIPKDEVGGDLMDLVADGPEVIAYVADVSGHGLRAGVLMGMIKTAMRYGLLLQRPLRDLISDLNRLLPQVKEPSMFATLAALRFDGSKEVEYVSAGHVPLLHFRKKTNDVISHQAQQLPLGLLPARGAVVTRRIPYEAGDIFALPTDGALELGVDPDAEEGLAVLARTLSSFHDYPLPEILEILQNEIRRHGPQHDDRTVLLVRVPSSDEEEPSRPTNDASFDDVRPDDLRCNDFLEAHWQKMLADLAASLADD